MGVQDIMLSIENLGAIRRHLRPALGWTWPKVLLRASKRDKEVFAATPWGREGAEGSAEARFLKPLTAFASLYLELTERLGHDEASRVMRGVATDVAVNLDMHEARAFELARVSDPMARSRACEDTMWRRGPGAAFNRHTQVRSTDDVLHLRITRCVYHEFFVATGTPMLARFICDSDRVFFEKLVPELAFDRDGSWQNTIAYGAAHCDYVWTRRPG